MKYNKNVVRSFAMITQLGLSMLAPVFLCIFLGYLIEDHFQIPALVPGIILGVMAGARNTYILAKSVTKDSQKKEDGND